MGIPKFARFLMTRYPLILRKIKDHRDIPEIDQLYLDINGIIHNVSHNNDVTVACTPKTSPQIYKDVCLVIDSILKLIRPKKLLMISADGVAPRAKMNQQRSRRFRKEELPQEAIDLLSQQGYDIKDMFNSDSISAGTEFMFNLSIYMNKYIEDKKKSDEDWKKINVLFTGSDVPGEGEHKILEYIRNYKSSNEYVSNTKHCIYGLDADLIMLSLITHEPNIVILREDSFLKKKKANDSSGKKDDKDYYEFILVSVLREYLELEFLDMKPKMKFDYNIERILDDFIFFCFFIGNDFLPNLNTMDIETGALGHIFSFYKRCLPQLDDYITYHGKIDFTKAKLIFKMLAEQELSSLSEMLEEIKSTCKENKMKKKHILNDKINEIKAKKMQVKKGKFYEDLRTKGKTEMEKFKKEKKKKKINFLKNLYEDKKNKAEPNKQFKFEEDVKEYLKQKSAKTVNEKEKMLNQAVVNLFESDDDEFKRKDKAQPTITAQSTANEILIEGTKFANYINDEAYCSDLQFDDISDSDVSAVDNKELIALAMSSDEFKKSNKDSTDETDNVEDLNKVFQEKLVQFYVTDVTKAKEFYYKEKLHIDITTAKGKEEQQTMFRKYLEGLQWVLFYYYRGIKSWRWYYPYHYAPMVSDFVDYKYEDDFDKVFANDTSKPFDPFLSLIFILPAKSFNLLPSCYSAIPNELKDLFPEKFQIDYNGKHTPWESITLIPFLDEEMIIAVEKKHRKLSTEEEKRNSWGDSYMYYSDGKKEKYAIYQKNNALLDSNYVTKAIDCSFPTLRSLQFDFSVEMTKMYYGKGFKKVPRIMIYPQLRIKNFNDQLIEKLLKTRNVFINYPYKTFGKLNGIVYQYQFYYLYENKLYIDPNFQLFKDLIDKISNSNFKKGIFVTYPDILCNVVPFKGIAKKNGKTVREYEEENSTYVPIEITSLNCNSNEFNEYKKHFTGELQKSDSSNFSSTNAIKGKKIYNKYEQPAQQYQTKKIITKNNRQIDKKFKTYPEGIEINTDANKISFDKSMVNQSEYREHRIFQNETIKSNQLYYYSSDNAPSIIANNSNIIFKHI